MVVGSAFFATYLLDFALRAALWPIVGPDPPNASEHQVLG